MQLPGGFAGILAHEVDIVISGPILLWVVLGFVLAVVAGLLFFGLGRRKRDPR